MTPEMQKYKSEHLFTYIFFPRQQSLCNAVNSLHSFTQTIYQMYIYHQSEHKLHPH